jgi:hypothetical protein
MKFAISSLSYQKDGIDLLICVDDPVAFHVANMHSGMNMKDYSMFQRFSAKLPHFYFKPLWKPINLFQRNFAKVHFNTTKVNINTGQLRTGSTKLRYGVVQYEDVIRDLNNWDNLVSSTFV